MSTEPKASSERTALDIAQARTVAFQQLWHCGLQDLYLNHLTAKGSVEAGRAQIYCTLTAMLAAFLVPAFGLILRLYEHAPKGGWTHGDIAWVTVGTLLLATWFGILVRVQFIRLKGDSLLHYFENLYAAFETRRAEYNEDGVEYLRKLATEGKLQEVDDTEMAQNPERAIKKLISGYMRRDHTATVLTHWSIYVDDHHVANNERRRLLQYTLWIAIACCAVLLLGDRFVSRTAPQAAPLPSASNP